MIDEKKLAELQRHGERCNADDLCPILTEWNDIADTMGKLWKVARKTSRLRASWIHHDEGRELSVLLEAVDPTLVPQTDSK